MRFVSISAASAVTGRNAICSGVRFAGTAGLRDPQLRARRRLAGRPLARQVRPEGDGRLGVERDVQLAQLLVAVEVAVDAAERHLLFGLGEVHAEDALGGVEAEAIDARRAGGRLLGQRRRGGAGGKQRSGRKEAASVHRCRHRMPNTRDASLIARSALALITVMLTELRSAPAWRRHALPGVRETGRARHRA